MRKVELLPTRDCAAGILKLKLAKIVPKTDQQGYTLYDLKTDM